MTYSLRPVTSRLVWALLPCLILMASCGEARRFGDVDGKSVAVEASAEKAFFDNMANHQWRPSVGAGVGFGSGGSSMSGVGVGFSFSSTQLYLLGGDEIGQGNVFRKELKWGKNSFQVPLKPGRTIHLTIQAQGGRDGWESIGSVIVPDAPDALLRITLDSNGPSVRVSPETAPPATVVTPPVPAAPLPSAAPAAPAASAAPSTQP